MLTTLFTTRESGETTAQPMSTPFFDSASKDDGVEAASGAARENLPHLRAHTQGCHHFYTVYYCY
jgi:hypothetical protein